MRQDLYDKINEEDPGLHVSSADLAASLAERTVPVVKPLDDRMLTERRVMGLIGVAKGEVFMQAVEIAPSYIVPSRVKAWFKPSEGGADALLPDVAEVIQLIVTAAEELSQSDADQLIGFAYDDVPEFPGVNEIMVQNARDQKAKFGG